MQASGRTLTDLRGIGTLTAGKIFGEQGEVQAVVSADAYSHWMEQSLALVSHRQLRMNLVKFARFFAAGATALAFFTATGLAVAAPTESSVLYCGSSSYVVTGFGRGTPLKVTAKNSNFVVKYARLEPSGQVVLDILGQEARADLVTCTTTSPSGQAYTFRGFFTPRTG